MSRTNAQLLPAFRQPTAAEPANGRKVADLDALAQLMDSAVEIPGFKIRFGLDSVLGLIPGVGDAASSMASLYILRRAQQLGVGRGTLARMIINVAFDLMAGAIPIAGDVFDVFWKANRRNVELLRCHLHSTPQTARRLRWTDRLFVGFAIALVVGLTIASVASAYYLVAWLFGAAGT